LSHVLVTNDFPPKVGGIQSYLWELWRRLPPGRVTVLTTPYEGAAEWDATQAFRVERTAEKLLLPTSSLRERIDKLAADVDAALVVLDPALPLGLVGRRLERPHAIVLHGAEVTVPGRLPVTDRLLTAVLRPAVHLIAAGGYPAAEARRVAGAATPPITIVPPGVDVDRFVPLTPEQRRAARRQLGLPANGQLVLGLSRLVPRKGFDVLIRAAAQLARRHPDLVVAIAGGGRDRNRLQQLAGRLGAPVRFLGRVPDDDLPALYGSADVFAMLCRNRWGGLEQEGFGIVFAEAAACGVPSVAGASGGSAEAVGDGETGYVVEPTDVDAVAQSIARILDDDDLRTRLGAAARQRAEQEFAYDLLAQRLDAALVDLEGG
jgi:phosphatidylinositol alpha-1,6-mannosyltransferase